MTHRPHPRTLPRPTTSVLRLGLASAFVALVLVVVAVLASPARAEELVVPIDTVIRIEPARVVQLSQIAITDEYVGATCQLTAVATNQESAHPGNDLIVTSGASATRIGGVEDTPGQTTSADGEIVLGSTLAVSLIMGPDGVFSGGIDVTVSCPEVRGNQVEPTTTVAPTTEVTSAATTVAPTTEAPATTTTAAAVDATETTVDESTTAAGESELAFTGSGNSGWLTLIAFGLIGAGLIALASTRAKNRKATEPTKK